LLDDDLGIWNRGGSGGQPFAIAGWNTALGIFINTSTGNVGIGTSAPQATLHVIGNLIVTNDVRVGVLRSGGTTPLCRNPLDQIAGCSSSLRYKTNVANFAGGMSIINRLRPISFTWKQDGTKDVGLGAEEVAPLFTFRNDKGEIEGVRYDRLGVVFVNALKEQQAQIERQQQQIEQQQEQIAGLKKPVCQSRRRAAVCK
jgi:hypothetical protein